MNTLCIKTFIRRIFSICKIRFVPERYTMAAYTSQSFTFRAVLLFVASWRNMKSTPLFMDHI
jgi:hypothetical protein